MISPSRSNANLRSRARQLHSSSWVEVDLGAIRGNVRLLQQLISPTCGIWAVIKANAYGHGAVPASLAALQGGAAGLAVASYAEATELRKAGLEAPILLLSPGAPKLASRVVQKNLIQTVCTPEMVQALSRAAQRLNRPAQAHLKIDTGMGRLGVRPEAAAEFAAFICGQPGLHLQGVFSHLATAETSDASYAERQYTQFNHALSDIAALGINPGVRHLANSAAALRFPHMRLDRVRTGLLVYGIYPERCEGQSLGFRSALTWKTRLAFTQKLPAGSPVSYGGTHVTRGDCVTGVLPLGYADGYPRRASNRASVLLNGRLCPVIGRVCMDHVIIDLTAAGPAMLGDEVVLLGSQGKSKITANNLAQWAETCVHEITTVIGPRVARIYINQDECEQ